MTGQERAPGGAIQPNAAAGRPMTFDERVRAVEPFGFTLRQRRFLVAVALHGGYCLRRQYLEFAGVRHGKSTREFFDRLVSDGLAERLPCRADRGHVYHLSAKRFYRAIDQEDNRNRRHVSSAAIARKVMLLDFVLSQLEVAWLATEDEKVHYFTEQLGVPTTALPQRLYTAGEGEAGNTTRFFIHKLPIFCTDDLPGRPATVNFVYLTIESSSAGFEQFLQDHGALLARLPAWSAVVIAPPGGVGLSAARTAFERHFHQPSSVAAVSRPDLRWYFVVRQQVERDDFTQLSVADIDRYRAIRPEFASLPVEALYARWLEQGEAALQSPPAAAAARLSVHVLPHSYTQFGSMPGVA